MLYTVVDVVDHSTMKEFVLDLIDNMPSKDVGVNTINLDDDYTDLELGYTSHISKTNWQDGIFGEEWAQIWPHFLSPADQFQVVKNEKQAREISEYRLTKEKEKKLIKCTNLCNQIEMYLENDLPLVVKYNVASLGEIKLCLAPLPSS